MSVYSVFETQVYGTCLHIFVYETSSSSLKIGPLRTSQRPLFLELLIRLYLIAGLKIFEALYADPALGALVDLRHVLL